MLCTAARSLFFLNIFPLGVLDDLSYRDYTDAFREINSRVYTRSLTCKYLQNEKKTHFTCRPAMELTV